MLKVTSEWRILSMDSGLRRNDTVVMNTVGRRARTGVAPCHAKTI
jgi:hypothetical protein